MTLFPETGDYVFPAGLATVHIDRDNGNGGNWEPNLWIIHQVSGWTAHGQGDIPWTCLADPEGNEFDVLTPR
jgi:hypothetical protein